MTTEIPADYIKENNFKGKFGPLEDEIQILNLEKYKNTPTFKGAFKQVNLN